MPKQLRKSTKKPFLQWVGGKQSLLRTYGHFFPSREKIRRYYEPFVGGGAVFFHLQPDRAVLSDMNPELMNTYRAVQKNVQALAADLSRYRNTSDQFYKVRGKVPSSKLQRASRVIFLNKTCYGGRYRVNKKGEFNGSFGDFKSPTICDSERLLSASKALQKVKLKNVDFEEAVKPSRKGDFVYLDPPYHKTSTRYTSQDFGENHQRRLAKVARRLSKRGCRVAVSNSDTDLVRDLYKGFRMEEVTVPGSFVSKKRKELLIMNYDEQFSIMDI